MSCVSSKRFCGVTLLTLASALTLVMSVSGCTYVNRHYTEPCNNRAFIGVDLSQYITSRFPKNSPVRMAVIPFTIPANVSFSSTESPGWGYEIARHVQSEMLPTGLVPIVEMFNRTDWPGKGEEFFAGSFGAITMAREAGYDLALIGYVDQMHSLTEMTAYVKVIEVESGVSVYYGKATVNNNRKKWDYWREEAYLGDAMPAQYNFPDMIDGISRCVVHGIKLAGNE